MVVELPAGKGEDGLVKQGKGETEDVNGPVCE